MRDLKTKIIVGLILLVVTQGIALFSLVHKIDGKVENIEANQRVIMAAMMGQTEFPAGPVRE